MAPSEPTQPGLPVSSPVADLMQKRSAKVTVKPRAPYHRTKVERMAYQAGFRVAYARQDSKVSLRQNDAVNAYKAGYEHGQRVQARKDAA